MKYTCDDDWYRARVKHVIGKSNVNKMELEVLYIDYGNSEIVGLDRYWELGGIYSVVQLKLKFWLLTPHLFQKIISLIQGDIYCTSLSNTRLPKPELSQIWMISWCLLNLWYCWEKIKMLWWRVSVRFTCTCNSTSNMNYMMPNEWEFYCLLEWRKCSLDFRTIPSSWWNVVCLISYPQTR